MIHSVEFEKVQVKSEWYRETHSYLKIYKKKKYFISFDGVFLTVENWTIKIKILKKKNFQCNNIS
jgi:riboflavin synthase alpha subunit